MINRLKSFAILASFVFAGVVFSSPANAVLIAGPSSVNFGNVPIGDQATNILTYSVTCEANEFLCILSEVGLFGSGVTNTPSGAYDFRILTSPDVLEGNTRDWIFELDFQPLSTVLMAPDVFKVTAGSVGVIADSATTTTALYGNGVAIPAPAAVWLFGTGLIGLIGFTRRRKAA